jgi:hypothetical protein
LTLLEKEEVILFCPFCVLFIVALNEWAPDKSGCGADNFQVAEDEKSSC